MELNIGTFFTYKDCKFIYYEISSLLFCNKLISF
jgi:hypothetical protein